MTHPDSTSSVGPSSSPAGRPSYISEWTVIALGGALGSSLRHAISLLIATNQFPAHLAAGLANVIGSFLLGVVAGYLESNRTHRLLRPFLTIGVLGSFTTFSALAMDNRRLAGQSGESSAAIHLAGLVLIGLSAFILGDLLSARAFDRDPQ